MCQGWEWLEESAEREFLCDADVTAEDLQWLKSDNKAGYFGVIRDPGRTTRPFRAQACRGRKCVTLGRYATAEEAALCVAQTQEGQRAIATAHGQAEEQQRQQEQESRSS